MEKVINALLCDYSQIEEKEAETETYRQRRCGLAVQQVED